MCLILDDGNFVLVEVQFFSKENDGDCDNIYYGQYYPMSEKLLGP